MAGAFSDEKENFMRLVVLVNEKGAEAFQECLLHFSIQHQRVKTFDQVLHNAKGAVHKLRGRVITAQQLLTLYPPGGVSVQTNQLDITLCFVLLRNICGLKPPLTTWDKPPAPGDNSAEGGLAQLKNIRNFLCHSQKPELSDADFNTHFDNAVDAILNIESKIPHWTVTRTALLSYKTQAISPTQEADLLDVIKEWVQEDEDLRKEVKKIRVELTNLQGTADSTKKKVINVETAVKKIEKDVIGMKDNLEKLVQSPIEIPKTKVNEAYVSDLKKELVGFYCRSMKNIQCDPLNPQKTMPLKDLVVNLVWVKELHQSVADTWSRQDNIHYRDIFVLPEGEKRILVQGRAGMGKTTFGKILVYDWSHRNEPCLERFESVFLLQMRLVKPEQSLVDMIKDQLLRQRPDLVEGLKDYIEKNEKCLFIFDGLDELGAKRSQEIDDIINGFYLREAYILFTSRPWLIQDLVSTDQGVDRHVRIEGFGYSGVCSFIEKLFSNLSIGKKNPEQVNETSSELAKQIRDKDILDLVTIPLIINMICLLFHHEKKLPNTISEIYIAILKLLHKRGSKSSKTEHADDFHEIMMVLGKLAFEGLLKEHDQLFFEYEQVIDLVGKRAFEIGFVSCEMVKDRMGDDTQVQFLHKSFQEFIAAYYVNKEFENKNEKPWEELKKKTTTVKELLNKASLLEFMAGESEEIAARIQNYIDEMIIKAFGNANVDSYSFVDGIDVSQLLGLQNKCLRNMKSTKYWENINCDKELPRLVQSSNSLAWINLNRLEFTKKTVERLKEILDKNNHCVSVYIGLSCSGDLDAMIHLVKVIKSHPKVKYKYLTLGSLYMYYGAEDWEKFFRELSGIKRLLGLVLCNCKIPNTVLPLLGGIINTNVDTLYELDLSGDETIQGNFQKLSDEITTEDELVLSSLNLSLCVQESDAQHLASFLNKAKRLKYFDLSACSCNVTESLLALENLRMIHLSGECWGDVFFKLLHDKEMLEEFHLSRCLIKDSQLEKLDLDKCLKLKVLALIDVNLTPQVQAQLEEKCQQCKIKCTVDEQLPLQSYSASEWHSWSSRRWRGEVDIRQGILRRSRVK